MSRLMVNLNKVVCPRLQCLVSMLWGWDRGSSNVDNGLRSSCEASVKIYSIGCLQDVNLKRITGRVSSIRSWQDAENLLHSIFCAFTE